MWGNTQLLEASDSLGVNTPGVQGQLVRISYGRPETWHWVFAAKLLSADDTQIGEQHVVEVAFDLTVGIGRASIILPRFEVLRWRWGNNTTTETAPLGTKWSTAALAPVRVDPSLGDTDPWAAQGGRTTSNVIDQIVAQDLQLQTTLTVSTLGTLSARVEVSAQFAPKTHIRPEWHLEHFPGGEHGG